MTNVQSAPYAVEFDPKHNVMHVTVCGFWDAAIVADFLAASIATAQRVARTHPNYNSLVDAREFPVQAAQITEGIARIMREGSKRTRGRTAVIAQSHLSRMQGTRLNQDPRLKVFLDEAEARAWLAEPSAPDGGLTGENS